MAIEIELHKKYGDFSLDVSFKSDSKRIGILGSSGSGKSLTLKSIAGINNCESGFIKIDDKILFDSSSKTNVKIQNRYVGYLFQNYALFPNMTVAQNILSGVKACKADKQSILEKLIKQFQLEGLENHFPAELSGGQQQRVALARIIASAPDVILLDEPFSALDAFLKEKLQLELFTFLESFEGTIIFVSHDRNEIYRFCDELLIIDKGKSVCFGPTKSVFKNPEYKSAAILTGCKNFSEVELIDNHTLFVKDWQCKISFELNQEIPLDIKYIGYRAHDFIPLWGKSTEESDIKISLNKTADFPFERDFYFTNGIVWKLQREKISEIEQKGIPDFLRLDPQKIMLLK